MKEMPRFIVYVDGIESCEVEEDSWELAMVRAAESSGITLLQVD